MDIVSLNGEWKLYQAGKGSPLSAMVPGDVMRDLLAAKKIPDPYYRDNEVQVQWVGDTDWIYRRSFRVGPSLLKHDRVLLRCDGLDTLATVKVNGTVVGKADNMFRVWEFDIKRRLRPGANTIEMLFSSPNEYIKKRERANTVTGARGELKPVRGRSWIRKEQCNFGWGR